MPSIYTNLKASDRKHIRTEKARIRRQFSDVVKQQELISELYKRMVGVKAMAAVTIEAPKKESASGETMEKVAPVTVEKKVVKKPAVKKVVSK